MKPFEIYAESVEAAVRIAQQQYDAYEDELDITVLDKGSRGFLGIFGARKAAISCRLKPKFIERKMGLFLKKLLEDFDSEVFFEVTLKGKTIKVVLDGSNISRLIGRHGKTVGAL
ncbi:MAG TPA: single-stranded DNA-binding protein, partial [Kosmotogaceae bacterium]